MGEVDVGVAGCVVIGLPAPMLAGAGRPVGGLGEWQVEPKLDGFRAVIGVTPDDRVVRTRTGRNITEQLPELASLCDIGADLVLDGELIAGAGRPQDFYGLAGAVVSRSRAERLTSSRSTDYLDSRTAWD